MPVGQTHLQKREADDGVDSKTESAVLTIGTFDDQKMAKIPDTPKKKVDLKF